MFLKISIKSISLYDDKLTLQRWHSEKFETNGKISVRMNSIKWWLLIPHIIFPFWWSVNVNTSLRNLIDSLFTYHVTFEADSKLRGRSTFKTYTYDWHIDPAALGSVRVIGAVFIADSWNPMANQAKLTIAPNQMKKKGSDTRIWYWNNLFFISY